MKMRFIQDEGGQALIQVSIAIIVLLGFAALAIDVSFGYSQRRDMQNAADAGALAGAYEMCFVSGDPAQAEAVAIEYATVRNLAQLVDPPPIPVGGLITVTTRSTVPTFLAGVIGFPEITVGATAVAACGAATSGCGLLPLALSIEKWERHIDLCPLETDIYIFTSKGSGSGPGAEEEDIDCVLYNCDFNNDGTDDVYSGGHRGWLDFSTALDSVIDDPCDDGNGNSCGQNELSCRITNDYDPKITLPACVAGAPGSRDANFTNPSILQSRIGHTIRVPLFSGACEGESGSCHGGRYQVERVGCVRIKEIKHNWKPFTNSNTRYNVIVAQVLCDGCSTTCGSTDGTPVLPGGLRAVNLTQ